MTEALISAFENALEEVELHLYTCELVPQAEEEWMRLQAHAESYRDLLRFLRERE